VLAGVGVAVLTKVPVMRFLASDLAVLSWTTGFQLALAPLLVGAPGALVALGAVPVLAIYLGGRQAARAMYAANHDALTGLANRALFTSRLAEALRKRPAERRSWLMMVTLDDFKSINDTLGHATGDVLLRHVAERMSEAVREGDVLARLGGDEFAILLSDCDEVGATAMAARVLEHLDEPVRVADLSLRVSASIGLAPCDGTSASVDSALQSADMAVHRAKERRGSIAVFTSAQDTIEDLAVDRLALGSELAIALRTGQVAVHFQPKVAATRDLAPAMEALVRWRHPQLGVVDPEAFVAVAEQTGMIRRLTEHVLDLALERCADWRGRGVPVRMCVNVSAKSLVDESLPALVSDALVRHGVPGDALQLEITETACVSDVPRSRAVLDALRATGATLAIDDFGTGFSSLTQLQALDLEEVKIDRSFVMAMEEDPQAAVIVRSVVNLGHSLGLKVCAEGCETARTLHSLRELGCDYVQGYYFGQPSPDATPLRALGAIAAA
jgi:diguanylate cyclase (GGDEF)-like protein